MGFWSLTGGLTVLGNSCPPFPSQIWKLVLLAKLLVIIKAGFTTKKRKSPQWITKLIPAGIMLKPCLLIGEDHF